MNTCAGCKRSFRTVQGLGLHWDWQRRKNGPCVAAWRDTTAPVADVDDITAAVRAADLDFESVGGSSRHYVRECLIPHLEAVGLVIVKRGQP